MGLPGVIIRNKKKGICVNKVTAYGFGHMMKIASFMVIFSLKDFDKNKLNQDMLFTRQIPKTKYVCQ